LDVYIKSKNITCFFLLIALCLLPLGCFMTAPWQQKSVATYQSMGEFLTTAQVALKSLCEDGTLDKDQCRDARETYNDAVSIYHKMGDAAILAIDTDDRTQYDGLHGDLSVLLALLNQFLVTSQ
jgi:hypothetical protein